MFSCVALITMIGSRGSHLADLLEQREPVHAGHLEVEQDQVGALADHRVQAFAAVGHLFDLQGLRVTHRAEDVRERLPDLRLVIHDEHAPRRHWPDVTVHPDRFESRTGRFAIQRGVSVSWWGFSTTGRTGWRHRGAELHYAWVVLGALVVVMLLASGLRAVFGVFIKPMETTFGWDRAALSGAAALSLLLLGAAGPFVGWLADHWGPRRVIMLSVVLLGIGTILTSQVTALWQVYITAGVLMALGSGGVGMSTAATVAARWFEGSARARDGSDRRRHVGGPAHHRPARGHLHPHLRLASVVHLARHPALRHRGAADAPVHPERPGGEGPQGLRRGPGHRPGRHAGPAGGPDRHRGRDSRPRVLAPRGQLLRVRLHVERARADPPGAARGRARLLARCTPPRPWG